MNTAHSRMSASLPVRLQLSRLPWPPKRRCLADEVECWEANMTLVLLPSRWATFSRSSRVDVRDTMSPFNAWVKTACIAFESTFVHLVIGKSTKNEFFVPLMSKGIKKIFEPRFFIEPKNKCKGTTRQFVWVLSVEWPSQNDRFNWAIY